VKLNPNIHFDKHSDVPLLERAFNPWRLLVGTEGFDTQEDEDELQKLANSLLSGQTAWTEKQVRFLDQALHFLLHICKEQSQVQPDPEWVRTNEAAKDSGVMPLFVDPEGAMEHLRQIRQQQVNNILRALPVVKAAIILTDQAHGLNRLFDTGVRIQEEAS